jgi:hypothetical protein
LRLAVASASRKELLACPILVAVARQSMSYLTRDTTTYHPSGMYRLTIKGIFFSLNSLIAICNGSVSPSRSTSTGAFMLICKALVPKILARSYLVIYGVVVL